MHSRALSSPDAINQEKTLFSLLKTIQIPVAAIPSKPPSITSVEASRCLFSCSKESIEVETSKTPLTSPTFQSRFVLCGCELWQVTQLAFMISACAYRKVCSPSILVMRVKLYLMCYPFPLAGVGIDPLYRAGGVKLVMSSC